MKLLFEGKYIVAHAENTADNVALVELADVLEGKPRAIVAQVSQTVPVEHTITRKITRTRSLKGNRTPCRVCGQMSKSRLGMNVHMARAHGIHNVPQQKGPPGRGTWTIPEETRTAILADLSSMTDHAIARKYGVSHSYVYGLRHPGFFDKARAKSNAKLYSGVPREKSRRELNAEKRDAVMADLKEGKLSYVAIMRKHDISQTHLYSLRNPGYFTKQGQAARGKAKATQPKAPEHTAETLPSVLKFSLINDYKEGRLNAREIADKYSLREKEDVLRIVTSIGVHENALVRASVR